MPEFPDVELYVEHVAARTVGEPLEKVRLASPFVLRSFDPPLRATEGKRVVTVSRIGKRIVLHLEEELFVVVHLMIAGRLRWKERGAKIPGKVGLAAFDFPKGTLILTEASTKKRASIHVVRGEGALRALDPGGLDPFAIDAARFHAALTRESHTIKRTLTDPRVLSGIGNAYSDEILWRAKMSPAKLTSKMTPEDSAGLFEATKATLKEWLERLRSETGSEFPTEVTAFRPEMAVHGKYGKPCPACGSAVQRIRYADNESNYCARCQTGGKLLADRSLSRLLKGDWPKTLEEMEERKASR